MERNEILDMLANGSITSMEAIALLDRAERPAPSALSDALSNEKWKAAEAMPSVSKEEWTIEEIKKPLKAESDPFRIRISNEDFEATKANGERPRWLKIRVSNLETGTNKVTVTLPVGLVSFGLNIARRFGAEFDDDPNVSDVLQMIKEGERGVLVNVEDEADNQQVQIYLD